MMTMSIVRMKTRTGANKMFSNSKDAAEKLAEVGDCRSHCVCILVDVCEEEWLLPV